MARTNLKVISMYLTEKDYKAVQRAADAENRSMSNFLHTVGVAAAYERIGEGIGFGKTAKSVKSEKQG